MRALDRIALRISQLARRFWLIPRSVIDAIKQRRRHNLWIELEAERLDRIRNPSKYRGKE